MSASNLYVSSKKDGFAMKTAYEANKQFLLMHNRYRYYSIA
ncbi:hypothetical protein THOG05_20211 [Vibrio rotiferianus]|nr:hypothetical protein THOG05_20211 [Vibrio rotiferianus]CAH1572428.1 hypothetical protein THOE12_30275 [Vibrio rotiferianus]CAH1595618.1 hypothetical protein THOG10_80156 [Vibrio rotiferianus]CAH1596348.1 hypothetical protein THOB06_80155 [Vibrio rotiferianus]